MEMEFNMKEFVEILFKISNLISILFSLFLFHEGTGPFTSTYWICFILFFLYGTAKENNI